MGAIACYFSLSSIRGCIRFVGIVPFRDALSALWTSAVSAPPVVSHFTFWRAIRASKVLVIPVN